MYLPIPTVLLPAHSEHLPVTQWLLEQHCSFGWLCFCVIVTVWPGLRLNSDSLPTECWGEGVNFLTWLSVGLGHEPPLLTECWGEGMSLLSWLSVGLGRELPHLTEFWGEGVNLLTWLSAGVRAWASSPDLQVGFCFVFRIYFVSVLICVLLLKTDWQSLLENRVLCLFVYVWVWGFSFHTISILFLSLCGI